VTGGYSVGHTARLLDPTGWTRPATLLPMDPEPAASRRLPLLAGLFGALLLAALLSPQVGLLVAWPMLFFVPGWFVLARFAPDLALPARVGMAVVLSVYLSAHLAYLVGLLSGGFGLPEALLTTAYLGLLTAILATRSLPHLTEPAQARFSFRPARGWRAYRWPWLLGSAAAVIVGGICLYGAWRLTDQGWVAGGWNWSDLLVHVAIGESILQGNFPPQVPYFAGAPLLYHWFADFHAAIASVVSSSDIITVFGLTNGLMAGVFVVLAWQLARVVTGSRRAATLAAVLALFGGGLGFIRLPLDLTQPGADLFELLRSTPYDNTWADNEPRFRIASVLGTGFLAHRATALGLPGVVAVLLLVHASLGRRPSGVLLAGVVAALLAPFHFYAFPATYLLVLLYVIARRVWQQPGWLRDAALFLVPIVLALPFILAPLLQHAGAGSVQLIWGWSEASFARGPAYVALFYITNLGVPLLLALAALIQRGTPARLFLGSWLIALFLVPNLVVVGAIDFDMNKYFQIMWVAVAILAGWLVRSWPRPIIAGILVLSILSPALVGVWHVVSDRVALSVPQERAARWIQRSVEPRARFVTDTFINSPVDLAGRLRLTTFGPYVRNLGYNPDRRSADVQSIYCDGAERARAIMDSYGALYVLSPGGLLPCASPTDFSASPLFETIYSAEGVTVWRPRSP
jgi:hypothetical protein